MNSIGTPKHTHERPPATIAIVGAFAAVYIVWGSTYLAIRFALETTQPFQMAAVRHFTAGVILYIFARYRGAVRPTLAHWRSTAIVGGLLLLGGNGGVVWAEAELRPGVPRVASGMAALLVATVPLWMVLMDWLRPHGKRPTLGVIVGLLVGFAGMLMLVLVKHGNVASVNPLGAIVLIMACFWWSLGSIYSRHAPLPKSPLLVTAMQMLAGGTLLGIVSVMAGEWKGFDVTAVSPKSWASLLYLIVFGSLLAFSAYVWLLQVASPAAVGTYAYVNPVVAVLLGWLFANEQLTARMLLAAAVILAGVVIITTYRGRTPPKRADAVPQSEEAALAEAEH